MTLQPDAKAVAAFKAKISDRFATSFTHLMTEVLPPAEGRAAAYRAAVDRALGAGFPSPVLLGRHAELRDAALAGDEAAFNLQRDAIADLAFAPAEAAFRIVPLVPSAWEGDGIEIIRRRIADDVGLTTQLSAPAEPMIALATERLTRARAIIATATPDWGAELDALLSEVILAVNDGRAGFAGGSVFDLFGAILFNPNTRATISHHLITLIHESSHLLLFAYHLDDEVLLNDPDQLYTSPLRQQGRPMEGIFHAMWVSARMAAFGRALLAAPDLPALMSEDEIAQLRQDTEAARRAYVNGHETVDAHAQLTALGAQIHADAAAAMAALPDER
ncbi:aKG-HExxH-type peptide beta-hydroxylase [Xinfangfangia pollutisoli]|uniref:aKG-HExxH-type peptide beta-hydroxylase n=1 Tax=Xinfangfangia pollutisoli TaxID=2865960 RepID=UPI001CD7E412|nr:HEXXH motif-containing putative peptide modification protein [Xinfangfangia pollutisoli]